MFKQLLSAKATSRPQPPLFSVGGIRLSERVRWLDDHCLLDPIQLVQRHVRGDWGDIGESECLSNEEALHQEGIVMSRYIITPRLTVAVITDEHRDLTLVKLVDEPINL
ncbi:methyltransferase [Pseudomonas sp. FME51]|uniref:methyltransferase n=1 Tax=Pseudomonas sp. FME51 TaxID=2742609 RepID=UPI0018663666|nr:methyltransferase [Pseudomonas sp. FME51]